MARPPAPDPGERVNAIVDASVVVELVTAGEKAVAVATALRGQRYGAPAHVDAETLGVIAKHRERRKLTDVDATVAVMHLRAMPLRRYPIHGDVAVQAWDLRNNVRMSDALYIAVAKRWDLPLYTLDGGMAASYDRAVLL